MYGSRVRIAGALLACLLVLPMAAHADKNVKIEYKTFEDDEGDWCVVKDSVDVKTKQVKVGKLGQKIKWKTKKVDGDEYPEAGGRWLIETKGRKEFVLCEDTIGPFTVDGNEYRAECQLVSGVMPGYEYEVTWTHPNCAEPAEEDPEVIFKDGAGLLPYPWVYPWLSLLLVGTTAFYWNRYRKLKP